MYDNLKNSTFLIGKTLEEFDEEKPAKRMP